jgi:putative endonuclease
MYYAYVIRSILSGRFYKGSCKDLNIRLAEHNAGKTFSTKPFIPWEIVYFEKFPDYYSALKREKYFKSAAGRKFLKKII